MRVNNIYVALSVDGTHPEPGRSHTGNDPDTRTDETMRVTVNIDVNEKSGEISYLTDLKERLAQYDLKASELAEEAGFERSQISRWLNKPNSSITLPNVVKLEQAIARLLRRRAQAKRRPRSTLTT